jgi:hypothetical protein
VSINNHCVFLGTDKGLLIKFDLDKNTLLELWPLRAPNAVERRIKPESLVLDNENLTILQNTENAGPALLCMARNHDGDIFLVMDVEGGYLSTLFSEKSSEDPASLRRVQFFPYLDGNKIGMVVGGVFYNRFGGLTFILQASTTNYVHDFLYSPHRVKALFIHESAVADRSSVFPNGNLAYSYHPDVSDGENLEDDDIEETPTFNSIYEIQDFHEDQKSSFPSGPK